MTERAIVAYIVLPIASVTIMEYVAVSEVFRRKCCG